MPKEKTMLDWLREKDERLKKILRRKKIYDYRVVGPMSLEDAPQVSVWVRLYQHDEGTWYYVSLY